MCTGSHRVDAELEVNRRLNGLLCARITIDLGSMRYSMMNIYANTNVLDAHMCRTKFHFIL